MKKLLLLGAIPLAAFFVWTKVSNNEPVIPNAVTELKAIFDKSRNPIDKADSLWVVVNKNRPLKPLEYEPENLELTENGHELRKDAAAALNALLTDARKEGHNLEVISGYRSYETQKIVYAREVATYGQAAADTQSAKPGHSEHQTGLAVDLGAQGCNLDECFGNTKEGIWLAENAHNYGFIVRYVAGKEEVTGYKPEPWHIRFIGKELAKELKDKKIETLEEFFEL